MMFDNATQGKPGHSGTTDPRNNARAILGRALPGHNVGQRQEQVAKQEYDQPELNRAMESLYQALMATEEMTQRLVGHLHSSGLMIGPPPIEHDTLTATPTQYSAPFCQSIECVTARIWAMQGRLAEARSNCSF